MRQLVTEHDVRSHGGEVITNIDTEAVYAKELADLADVPEYLENGQATGDINFHDSPVFVIVNSLVRYRQSDGFRNLALLRPSGRWNGVSGFAMGRGEITPLSTVLTEVVEETCIPADAVSQVRLGGIARFKTDQNQPVVAAKAVVELSGRPNVVINEEHQAFEWLRDVEYAALSPVVSLALEVHDDFGAFGVRST